MKCTTILLSPLSIILPSLRFQTSQIHLQKVIWNDHFAQKHVKVSLHCSCMSTDTDSQLSSFKHTTPCPLSLGPTCMNPCCLASTSSRDTPPTAPAPTAAVPAAGPFSITCCLPWLFSTRPLGACPAGAPSFL